MQQRYRGNRLDPTDFMHTDAPHIDPINVCMYEEWIIKSKHRARSPALVPSFAKLVLASLWKPTFTGKQSLSVKTKSIIRSVPALGARIPSVVANREPRNCASKTAAAFLHVEPLSLEEE